MRYLKAISIAAAFGMVFTLAPLTGHEQQAQATTPDPCEAVHQPLTPPQLITEEGDFDGFYEIASAKDLVYLSRNFRENVGGGVSGEWREKHFVQTEPIDLGDCLFTPIGSRGSVGDNEMRFTGSYNGQFAPISGLLVARTAGESGLFGTTLGARLKQTVLRDVSIKVEAGPAGALVGYAFNTTILESSATGSVEGSSNNLGGLTGGMDQASEMSASFANVSVTATGTSGISHGGLIGLLLGGSVTNSYALGPVNGNNNVGGLVGSVQGTVTISQSFARNSVTAKGNSVGGLVGNDSVQGTSPTISDSFWDVNISGLGASDQTTGSEGGTGKTTAQMRNINTFRNTDTVGLAAAWPIVSGWEAIDPNDNKVWGIRSDVNDGYPYLLWETTPVSCLDMHGVGEEKTLEKPTRNDAGVYEIGSASQLVYFSLNGTRRVDPNDTSTPVWLGQDFVQTAPIDLGGCSFLPIGTNRDETSRAGFVGSFDGGHFPITGLTITGRSDRGFFAFTNGATIRRVDLRGVDVSGTSGVGGLAGRAIGKTTISESSVTGSVSGRDSVGGLLGVVWESTVRSSFTYVDVSGDSNGLAYGGLVGRVGVRTGNITSNSLIEDSYARGTVSNADRIGGLVGEVVDLMSEIKRTYSTAVISNSGNSRGGLIGEMPFDPFTVVVTDSFWDLDTSNQSSSPAGTGKPTELMQTLSTFADADWSISCQSETPATTWGIAPTINQGYPFLVALNDSPYDSCASPEEPDTITPVTPETPDPTTSETTDNSTSQQSPTGTTGSQNSGGTTTVTPETPEPTTTQTPFGGFREPPTTAPNTDTTTPVIPEGDTSSQNSTDSPTADGLGGGDTTQDATTPPASTTGVSTWWLWGIGLGGLGAAALIAGGVAWARGRV